MPSRRSEPVRRHVVVLEAALGELGSCSGAFHSGGRGRGEVGVVLPHCPGDARELVGEGDGRFVVSAEALEVQRPGAQPVRGRRRLRLRMTQHRARAPWIIASAIPPITGYYLCYWGHL